MYRYAGFVKAALDVLLAGAALPNYKVSVLFCAYAVADVAAALLV